MTSDRPLPLSTDWSGSPVWQREVIASAHLVLPAQQPPWQRTGLAVQAGQHYSVFARGRIEWSARHPQLHGGPRFHLWARVAGGRIQNLRADTDTFVADLDGELELGLYMGMWRDDRGALASDIAAYTRLQGAIEVSVLVWRREAASGLAALCAAHPGEEWFSVERSHLARPVPPPAGWRYLTEAGHAECYSASTTADGTPCITLEGEDDQGILIREVDFALTPDTRLRWRWRVDEHPSRVAEDTPWTHDYVSVATQFDDGRDLTWIWSSTLPVGHHFACPIKAWSQREWHYVTHSGSEEFGRWCQEDRPVHADVAAAIGPPPARITRVWLIVVATFQHGRFRAQVADLELCDGKQTLRVL